MPTSIEEFRKIAVPMLERGATYAEIGEAAGGITKERVRQRIHQDPELVHLYRSMQRTRTSTSKRIYQRFGECLVAIRHRLNLSQEELGHILGRARPTIGRWETVYGRGTVTLEAINDTAEKLEWIGVTAAWLMGEPGAPEPVIHDASIGAARRLLSVPMMPVGPGGVRQKGRVREAPHTPNLLRDLLLRVERLEATVQSQAESINSLKTKS